jgi:hypothetical protein
MDNFNIKLDNMEENLVDENSSDDNNNGNSR